MRRDTSTRGWSGGAMVLGKLPVPGRPINLDLRRAKAYCACSRCGCGCLNIFSLVFHFVFLSPSLWKTARYRLKYCLKGPLSRKQPTNQRHIDQAPKADFNRTDFNAKTLWVLISCHFVFVCAFQFSCKGRR